jgi:hypothetical protein
VCALFRPSCCCTFMFARSVHTHIRVHKYTRPQVGLDHRFARSGFYGKGLYLAEQARYSAGPKYAHCPAHPDVRRRQLLLVRAAVGSAFDFGQAIDRDLTKPPEQDTGVLYDSVQGGPHRPTVAGPGPDDSSMVVLYDLAQAYPEYVVTFEMP